VFSFGKPTDDDLDRVLTEQRRAELTYAEVGATAGVVPVGYRHDTYRIDLGRSDRTFARAVEGLRAWEAHRGAGLRLRPERPDLTAGVTLVLAKALPGLSAIAACRIVSVTDEPGAFGFAYGTLPAHPEQGEEAFLVLREADGNVSFAITAFSRPRHPLARLGGPVTRWIQQDTTRRYLEALKALVTG
jgi:uncharacterized protein (UPF0548 family)